MEEGKYFGGFLGPSVWPEIHLTQEPLAFCLSLFIHNTFLPQADAPCQLRDVPKDQS